MPTLNFWRTKKNWSTKLSLQPCIVFLRPSTFPIPLFLRCCICDQEYIFCAVGFRALNVATRTSKEEKTCVKPNAAVGLHFKLYIYCLLMQCCLQLLNSLMSCCLGRLTRNSVIVAIQGRCVYGLGGLYNNRRGWQFRLDLHRTSLEAWPEVDALD